MRPSHRSVRIDLDERGNVLAVNCQGYDHDGHPVALLHLPVGPFDDWRAALDEALDWLPRQQALC